MRTSLLVTLAALVVALPAAAQNTPAPAAMTLQSIDKSKPFGSLDVKAVDAKDPAKVMAWGQALNEQQKLDLNNRCSVINANQSSFLPDDVSLCHNWIVAQAGEAPAPVR